jgi:hypothetical protein
MAPQYIERAATQESSEKQHAQHALSQGQYRSLRRRLPRSKKKPQQIAVKLNTRVLYEGASSGRNQRVQARSGKSVLLDTPSARFSPAIGNILTTPLDNQMERWRILPLDGQGDAPYGRQVR